MVTLLTVVTVLTSHGSTSLQKKKKKMSCTVTENIYGRNSASPALKLSVVTSKMGKRPRNTM